MSDVFISYASEDRDRVALVAKALEANGWSVWWDRKIAAGQAFDRVIEDALANAKCVVVVWSRRSIESTWVRAEATEALRRHRLVPIVIDDVQPPLVFRQIQTADLGRWTGDPSDESFKRFSADLTQALEDVSSPGPTKARGAGKRQRLPKRLMWPSVAGVCAAAIATFLGYRSVVAPRGDPAAIPRSRTTVGGASQSAPVPSAGSAAAFALVEIVASGRGQAIRWATRDANEVSINGKPVELSGIVQVDPSTSTTYLLVAKGQNGEVVSRTVRVGSRQPGISLRATPQTLSGEQVKELYQTKGLYDSRWNPGGDVINNFEMVKPNGDAVVIDQTTGLMWHQSGSASEMADWDDVRSYLTHLNDQRYAGFSDWRLPTLEELATIIEPNKAGSQLHINAVFDSRQAWLWSADDAGERYGRQAWGIDLGAGHANIHSRAIARFGFVRPLRRD